MKFIPVMAKLNFHLNLEVSHDPSEITLIWWFAAQETNSIIINVENSQYFCENTV